MRLLRIILRGEGEEEGSRTASNKNRFVSNSQVESVVLIRKKWIRTLFTCSKVKVSRIFAIFFFFFFFFYDFHPLFIAPDRRRSEKRKEERVSNRKIRRP